jgi:RNA polymerase sigma factor (sigma-70 family)
LPGLLRFAVMLTGDPDSAADLVQDAMVKVQLRGGGSARVDQPDRYVRRMITNTFIDQRRLGWSESGAAGRTGRARAGPRSCDATADRDLLWTLLTTLPRQQRAALVLRYYEGLRDDEIAEVIGCSVGTVRGYISRALATLRLELPAVLSEEASDDRGLMRETFARARERWRPRRNRSAADRGRRHAARPWRRGDGAVGGALVALVALVAALTCASGRAEHRPSSAAVASAAATPRAGPDDVPVVGTDKRPRTHPTARVRLDHAGAPAGRRSAPRT